MVDPDDRRGGWAFRLDSTETRPLDYVTQVAAPAGESPLDLHLVFTEDGLYVPAVVRTPPDEGPFPMVVCVHGGSGGLGISWLVDFVLNRGYAFERFLKAGYAVCVTEGRMEVEEAYNLTPIEETTPPLPAVLDHDDLVTTYRYLRDQRFVDEDRIAFFGVSHGGEMQMKLISELEDGPAALIPMEPAVIEYLELQYEGPRVESNLQFNHELDDEDVALDRAMARIEPISEDLPILVGGREDDHLQGLFLKLYELLDRAGKDVRWASWDHPDHAYQWGPYRATGDVVYHGSISEPERHYDVDEPQRETLDTVVAFLDEHV